VGSWAWRDFAAPFVTPTLHRFGRAAHRAAAIFRFACSTLDQMVKTKALEKPNSLIERLYSTGTRHA
jgi:hypothetical protein